MHTPGPWRFDAPHIRRVDGKCVARLPLGREHAVTGDEAMANGELIASAPTLRARIAALEAELRRKVEYLVSLRALKAVTGPTIDAEIESATVLLSIRKAVRHA